MMPRFVDGARRVVGAVRADGGRRLLCAALAATVLVVVAEAVLLYGHDELGPQLDRRLHAYARHLASEPALRATASVVSRLTGEGLVVAVVAATLGLVVARRRPEAWILVVGTLGSWIASGILKVAFGFPRPRAQAPWRDFVSYGFPSGHAFVTLVACGLIAWALGRRAARPVRIGLVAAAGVIALFGGAARVILNAHWPSDVIGGLAFGTAWLSLVVAVAEPTIGAGVLAADGRTSIEGDRSAEVGGVAEPLVR